MKLNPQQVQKVAKLANIPVSEEEVEKYSDRFSGCLAASLVTMELTPISANAVKNPARPNAYEKTP